MGQGTINYIHLVNTIGPYKGTHGRITLLQISLENPQPISYAYGVVMLMDMLMLMDCCLWSISNNYSRQWDVTIKHRESNPVLCDHLDGGMGWRWEGRSRGRGPIYWWVIHVVVWQKPTQHCKAIILQLKVNLKKECVRKKEQ